MSPSGQRTGNVPEALSCGNMTEIFIVALLFGHFSLVQHLMS